MAGVEYAVAPDGTHIAYRVLDRDPGQTSEHSIVMVTGGLIPMGVFDDDPGIVRMLDGLRSIGRVIVFDRRGIGVSDPITDWDRPVIDQWVDDLGAVIDASGAEQTVVFAWDSFGVATRLAAERPSDLDRIVVFQPLGGDDEQWQAWIAERTDRLARTGSEDESICSRASRRPHATRRFASGSSRRDGWARAPRPPGASGSR